MMHGLTNLKTHKTNSKHVSLLGFYEDNEKKGKTSAKSLLQIFVIYAFFMLKTFSHITREYSHLDMI